MVEQLRLKNTGLRGVVVADSRISTIDGIRGKLIYRGYRIEELAERSNFLETAFLLLTGQLPNRVEIRLFLEGIASARYLPVFLLEAMTGWPGDADPMDVLQSAVALLGMNDPEPDDQGREADLRRAAGLIGATPVIIASWHRISRGLDIPAPDPSLSHCANFQWMLSGRKPAPPMERALDVSLILQAEHTLNASTFACREVVSTGARMYAGASAGIGALSGSLHGGANARVIRLVEDLAASGFSPGDASSWVREKIASGRRIMGMGHAVYKTYDPRALILKRIARDLTEGTPYQRTFELLEAIDDTATREFERIGKPGIKANVDFYTGVVYRVMGIPVDLLTPVFAMALLCGWCAHMLEEKHSTVSGSPVMYSPGAEYIGYYCGNAGCEYMPIDDR